jgi:hypothetical protein
MRGSGIDVDDNDLSKDGENSLSQSLFDDQTSSRTRKDLFLLKLIEKTTPPYFSINWSKNQ